MDKLAKLVEIRKELENEFLEKTATLEVAIIKEAANEVVLEELAKLAGGNEETFIGLVKKADTEPGLYEKILEKAVKSQEKNAAVGDLLNRLKELYTGSRLKYLKGFNEFAKSNLDDLSTLGIPNAFQEEIRKGVGIADLEAKKELAKVLGTYGATGAGLGALGGGTAYALSDKEASFNADLTVLNKLAEFANGDINKFHEFTKVAASDMSIYDKILNQ